MGPNRRPTAMVPFELSPLTESQTTKHMPTRHTRPCLCHRRVMIVALVAATALLVVFSTDSRILSAAATILHNIHQTMNNNDTIQASTFNASRELDFAVIGFPKTGTTFLLEVLRKHPEISMPQGEFCQIHHDNGDKELTRWMKNQSSSHPPGKKYGIKCPTMIRVTNAIENLMKTSDQTRLVIGVRHPVLWFQSFYNYRVEENYRYPQLNHDSPIQSPFGLNSTHHWRECSTAYGKFDIFLKQLAKVSLSGEEMIEMIRSDTLWQKRVSINPYKIFIYTSDQLSDNNDTRQYTFRHDLKEFLRLDTPLIDLRSAPKINANTHIYPEYIDICKPKYTKIRKRLLKSGRKASEWILNKFIKSNDVFVSNVDYFQASLRTWGTDPCL